TVATLPSALFEERLSSLGASWVFSFQPVLPPDYRPRFHLHDESWARRLTQSPELGFKLWLFLSQSVFGFMRPPASPRASNKKIRRLSVFMLHAEKNIPRIT